MNLKKPLDHSANIATMERPTGCWKHHGGPNRNGSYEDHVMAKRQLPSPEVLRQLLSYDPETGKLFWKERPVSFFRDNARFTAEQMCRSWNNRFVGVEALATRDGKGYLAGTLLCMKIYAHRAGWAIHYGYWPEHEIDHIDGDGEHNWLSNLREAHRSENQQNRKVSSNSTSGHMGVSYHIRNRKWTARITVNNQTIRLGSFATPEMAAKAYKLAKRKYHRFNPEVRQ